MKTGMNDQSVLQLAARDGDGANHFLNGFNLKRGDGESDLYLKQIAEGSQACIQDDVANLGDHFARGAVELGVISAIGQEPVEQQSRLAIQEQKRVSADGAREHLIDARDVAFNNALERLGNLADVVDGYLRHFKGDSMAREVREGCGGTGITDINQLGQGIGLWGCQLHTDPPARTISRTS